MTAKHSQQTKVCLMPPSKGKGEQNAAEVNALTKEIGALRKSLNDKNIKLGKFSKRIEMLENGLDGFYEELFDLLRYHVDQQKYHVKINEN